MNKLLIFILSAGLILAVCTRNSSSDKITGSSTKQHIDAEAKIIGKLEVLLDLCDRGDITYDTALLYIDEKGLIKYKVVLDKTVKL